ncbi:MAG: DNA mismatch repair protein MutS [Bacteroidetes bacterium]|jgi:DNA mismatch repair protein MutS|nr:DNA mismatch repair protein MutS [Bacteroidota bacterium]
MAKKSSETPLMQQYYRIKGKHPDAILLFRVGDFYETFESDAVEVAKILGITLTKRANGSASYVNLAGFPYHSLDTYLPKLVRAGQRVAICEQLEDPKKTKKIVKRGITELVTPGVSMHENTLEHKENNFLACVYLGKTMTGVAFLDISTGEFMLSEGNMEFADKLLQSMNPKEVLYQKSQSKEFSRVFGERYIAFPLDEWIFTLENAYDKLLHHFKTKTLKGYGVEDADAGIIAAGAIMNYLEITEHRQISHITGITRIASDNYVWLDRFTIRNLEIFQTLNEGGKALIDILDRTQTAMGARLLKRWLAFPLVDVKPIEQRLDAVDYFLKDEEINAFLDDHLDRIGDLERLISKVAVGKVNPREVNQLKLAFQNIQPIKTKFLESENTYIRQIADQLNPCTEIRQRIENELNPDPPVLVSKGNVIASGVNGELDELRKLAHSGKDYLLEMQIRESKETGISSLKIGYNNVFGYYFEVRNTHKEKVPEHWIRKQTLVSAERYINEELKEYETKILGAEEKILELEQKIFIELVMALNQYMQAVQLNASLIAQLDCILSFAKVSEANNYSIPRIDDSFIIDIHQGRHPVIEQQLPPDEEYVANDVLLDSDNQQIMMITGPNMSGKSALLRQTALIVLMAQSGCFVPVESATIGVVDKIFTRVGASDNISLGESTFMVEMNEAASILNNLSDRSLILLDELGRGTSTYDGISIAWAIAEYIHENPKVRAKTLFATHYHELNEMEKSFPRIRNYNVSVKEIENRIIFLRKLAKGGSEHSFGIHVARMAGMPPSVVQRANEILGQLESASTGKQMNRPTKEIVEQREGMQMSIFQLDDPVLKDIRDKIKNLDVNNLTPVEALNKLNEIKRLSGL